MRLAQGRRAAFLPMPYAFAAAPRTALALLAASACAILAAAAPAAPSPARTPRPGSASPSASAGIEDLPCRDMLARLPAGRFQPGPYLDAAACLRRADSAGESGMPLEALSASGSPPPAVRFLRSRLEGEKAWLPGWIARMRGRTDPGRLPDMAWLAEAYLVAAGAVAGAAEAEAWGEIASAHLASGDRFHAGLALLKQAEADSAQALAARYQLANLAPGSEAEAAGAGLFDSLADLYPHRVPRTAEMLEAVAWSVRAYPAAFRAFQAWQSLRDPGPAACLDRANRFRAMGYADYAAAILEKLDWRKQPQPWRGQARMAMLRIRHQAQDWAGLLAEAGDSGAQGKPSQAAPQGEEACLIASALLRTGRAKEAAESLRGPAAQAPSPWGFQARLLLAQAQIALAAPREAARTLAALKRDPDRREGTGPILFWQAGLALDQADYRAADSLLVLASAYTGAEETQRALDYRFFLLLDTASANRGAFFRGLPEAPRGAAERGASLDKVPAASPLWPFARLEKAQILLSSGRPDSALAVFDTVARRSPERLAAYQAEARAAFVEEKLPGGRQAALARYENLLIKYQRGVIPEFSRGRIRALQ